jgi:predicted nucleic acid-binding protein
MKKYLLDTNVISEIVRPTPDPNVIRWLEDQKESTLFICAVTFGELAKGVAALADGKKKDRLLHWLKTEVTNRFSGRILPFDDSAALLLGEWNGTGTHRGRSYSVLDSQIAAIAARFGCVLVTRNTKDIDGLPVESLNPWKTRK